MKTLGSSVALVLTAVALGLLVLLLQMLSASVLEDSMKFVTEPIALLLFGICLIVAGKLLSKLTKG